MMYLNQSNIFIIKNSSSSFKIRLILICFFMVILFANPNIDLTNSKIYLDGTQTKISITLKNGTFTAPNVFTYTDVPKGWVQVGNNLVISPSNLNSATLTKYPIRMVVSDHATWYSKFTYVVMIKGRTVSFAPDYYFYTTTFNDSFYGTSPKPTLITYQSDPVSFYDSLSTYASVSVSEIALGYSSYYISIADL
jgi:hypothetical protein